MSLSWIPNAICVVRVLLVYPIVTSLLGGRFDFALILIVIAGGSDAIDGFLAKTFDWRTRIGGLLDPAADKVLVTSTFVTLSYIGLVPTGLTAIVVGRDVVIISGVLAYLWLLGPVRGEPTMISKLNTAFQLLFLVLTIVRAEMAWPPEPVLLLLGAAVVFTSITSGLNYVVQWSRRALEQRPRSA